MDVVQTIASGYAITPRCLSPRECDEIADALSAAAISRSRAGIRHLMSNPTVAALAIDDRLIELAKEWLGHVAVPFRATLFEKSYNTNWLIPWHQDTALPLTKRLDATGWGPLVGKGRGHVCARSGLRAISCYRFACAHRWFKCR